MAEAHRRPHARNLRRAFLEDLRILWDRGTRDKQDIARTLGIKVPTLDRRLARARHDGDLPPAKVGSPHFDPFRLENHVGGYFRETKRPSKMTKRVLRPPNDFM